MVANAKKTVFIGGDGRSGTTLLSVILDTHPEICVLPELHFHLPRNLGPDVLNTLRAMDLSRAIGVAERAQVLTPLKLPMQFVNRCARAGISKETLQAAIEESMDATESDLTSLLDRFHLIDRLGRNAASLVGKQRWGLKIMKQIVRAEEFADFWPEAHFVHVVRDGRDVAASQIKDHNWGYETVADAAVGWASLVGSVQALGNSVHLSEVRYEDLVKTPKKTLQELSTSLGLTWNQRLLKHAEYDHALLHSSVRHPSSHQVSQPIYTSAVGRYYSDLTRDDRRIFMSLAGAELSRYGYQTSPEVRCSFNLDEPLCRGLSSCLRYRQGASDRLVGRYIGLDRGQPDQIHAARLDLNRWIDYESYLSDVRKRYKGAAIRQANKARKLGLEVHQFHRSTFVPDIVEINQSKRVRSGGEMRPAYLRSVEESGGYPTRFHGPDNPACSQHYDMWWGVFEPSTGRTQGSVVVGEKLLGYINFRRYGSFALYNLILGHGDWLNNGIMYLLHFELMERLLDPSNLWNANLESVIYAGFFQGGEGLQQWKKKTLFEPCLLYVDAGELEMR